MNPLSMYVLDYIGTAVAYDDKAKHVIGDGNVSPKNAAPLLEGKKTVALRCKRANTHRR